MAQDIVVKESLSNLMVRDGAALVAKLDEMGWRPNAAFWFYFPETNAWRLLLASAEVTIKGPREAYTAIQNALAELDLSGHELALDDIGVMPAEHPLIGLLGSFIKTGPGLSSIRFSKNVVNGHFIDDALIYRIM